MRLMVMTVLSMLIVISTPALAQSPIMSVEKMIPTLDKEEALELAISTVTSETNNSGALNINCGNVDVLTCIDLPNTDMRSCPLSPLGVTESSVGIPRSREAATSPNLPIRLTE